MKKLIVAIAACSAVAFIPVGVARGQVSVSSLQALVEQLQVQIKLLQAQVVTLQTQLTATNAEVAEVKSELKISRSLQRGAAGDEVKELQTFLKGFPDIYPAGLITGYYGPMTELAVRKFQEKYGIETTGSLGPKTLAKLNAVFVERVASSTLPVAPTFPLLPLLPVVTGTVPTPAATSTPAVPVMAATSTSATATSTATSTPVAVPPSIPASAPASSPSSPAPSSSPSTTATTPTATSTATSTASGDTAAPSVPSGLTVASTTANKTFLSWTKSTDNTSVAGYKVYRDGAFITNAYPTSTSDTNVTYLDTSVAPSITYAYAVAAYDDAGNTSAQSTSVSFTTAPPVSITVSSPSGGEELQQGGSLIVNWSSTGILSHVQIELASESTTREYLAYVPNTGSWTWSVPSNRTFLSGKIYKIRISNGSDLATYAESPGYFSFYVPPAASPADPSSLLGHWKFDGNGNNEVSGGAAVAAVGSARFESSGGKFEGYGYIPGGSDSFKIPYSSTFDLPGSFTVEFWFRQRGEQPFLQDLVYKGTPINNYNFRVFRQLWNQYNFGPIITGYTSSVTGYWTQTSNSNQLAHNAWHHVVYTKDTSQSAYYLDGNQINVATGAQPAKTPALDVIIGDSAVDTDIDNLKIYNRALTSTEVLQSYGSGSARAPQNLNAQFAAILASFQRLLTEAQSSLGR